jgi:hypothetical protein
MTDAPGPICSRADLLDWAGQERFDPRGARELTRLLQARGLRPSPSLQQVLADIGEQRWSPEWDTPGRVIEGVPLRTTLVRLRRTRAPLVGGAAWTTLIAGCITWYRWPPYGLVSLAAGAAATATAWRCFDALDRALPSRVSRGAILGVGVALGAILAALAVLVAARQLG